MTSGKKNQKKFKEQGKPGWILQADGLPTHGTLGASLGPTRFKQNLKIKLFHQILILTWKFNQTPPTTKMF